MKKRKLNEVFTEWADGEGGIFYFLNVVTGTNAVPWKNENISDDLDILYHGNKSGDKIISPVVDKVIPENDLTFSTDATTLANAICAKFSKNWQKLYATLSLQYNPIENYSMTETHTGTETDTQTPTDWKSTTTQTPTDWTTSSEALSEDNNSNTRNSVHAFNTSDAVPNSETATESNSHVETTQTGTYETETEQTGTFEKETEYNTTLKRSGNVGVTTSQQMIDSERKLWFWNFFDKVFADLDSILTIKVY